MGGHRSRMKIAVTFLAAINARFYENYHQIRVDVKSEWLDQLRETLSQFKSIELWSPLDDKHDQVTFSISQTEIESLTVGLWDCGLVGTRKDNGFYIESDDLSRRIKKDHENSENLRDMEPSEYPFDIYLNGDQYNAWLDDVVTRYPDNIMTQSFGLTYENRDVNGYVLHKGNPIGKPTISIDCGIHAREWISPAVCRLFIDEYLRCSRPNAENCDPFVVDNFYNYNFAMLPLLNQDGYYYTWSNDRLWRKNRTPSVYGPCIGTDLNRNSDVAWGTTGSSDNTCSQTYSGVGPFSELTMQHWKDAVFWIDQLAQGKHRAYLSMHSYSQKIISSYAVSTTEFPHEPFSIDQMNAAGKAISDAMTAVNGVKYEYGQSRDILYPSAGTSKDYVLDELRVPLSWTWELR